MRSIVIPSKADGVIALGKNKLVDLIGKLSEQQAERLTKIAMEYLELNTELEDTAPKSCPCCKSAEASFIKKGFSRRKQRYQCKSCGKKFTYDVGKITAYSQQTEDIWAIFIKDTLSLKSLDECAANRGGSSSELPPCLQIFCLQFIYSFVKNHYYN